jgi:hypothetical protein
MFSFGLREATRYAYTVERNHRFEPDFYSTMLLVSTPQSFVLG